ncbi:MAG: putative metal-binding motif-containing protein, partial [Myxococcota bacterium]
QSSAPAVQFARVVPSTDVAFASGCGSTELLPAGTYYYRLAAVTARGEGLASRSFAVRIEPSQAPACVELQWEQLEAAVGPPERLAADAYIVYRTTSPDGSAQTERYLATAATAAPATCRRADGSATSFSGCQAFYDTGEGDLAPAPGPVSYSTRSGTLAAGFWAYRVSTQYGASLEVASGKRTVYQLSATGGVDLAWAAVSGASGYCIYRTATVSATAALASVADTQRLACASSTTYADSGTTAGAELAPEPFGRLSRGMLSKWEVVKDSLDQPVLLNTARWGHEALAIQVAPSTAPNDVHHYIFVTGGRPAIGANVTSVGTTERVEVSARTGDFLVDAQQPSAHWAYEVKNRTGSFACDGTTPDANCVLLTMPRAYFSMVTSQGRGAGARPEPFDDPCAIPDRDGDGYNSVACGGGDCDDTDSQFNPGAPAQCVGERNRQTCGNCCLLADIDTDGDGYPAITDPVSGLTCCDSAAALCDCNDGLASIYPGANDICGDAIDQNCDGQDTACACPSPSDCSCCTQEPLLSAYDPDGDGLYIAGSVCCNPSAGCNCEETSCTPWPPTTLDFHCCSQPEVSALYDPDGNGLWAVGSPCCAADPTHCESTSCSPWLPTASDCSCCWSDAAIRAQYDMDNDGLFADGSVCCVPGATTPGGGCPCEVCDPFPPSGGDYSCCTHPSILPTVDRDGDGYFDAASACCNPSVQACDCNDLVVAIHPGATELCSDGIDQNCDTIDPPCVNCDGDGDGYDSADQAGCGGTDCCDAGNEPSLGCSAAARASINIGVVENNFVNCEDGIDNNCDGVDSFCAFFANPQDSVEPIYLVVLGGASAIASGSETGVDNKGLGYEMAVIETSGTSPLFGHLAWDEPCTALAEGKTCVKGWELDTQYPTGTSFRVGVEALLYDIYVFRFAGGAPYSLADQTSVNREAFCLYSVSTTDPVPSVCPDRSATPSSFDINDDLMGVGQQNVGGGVGNGRLMFTALRLFSKLFFIGGLNGNGVVLPAGVQVEQANQ